MQNGVAAVLARPDYLDTPLGCLLPSLTGRFVFAKGQAPVDSPALSRVLGPDQVLSR